jgi:uncharacterized membrane-anchored protein YhcB (DUF1043 family)
MEKQEAITNVSQNSITSITMLNEKTKSTSNLLTVLLIILALIIIGLVIALIVVGVKLHKKKKDYNKLKDKYNELNNNYNQTDSFYSSRNDSLNDIFNVYQRLIQKTNVVNPNISKDSYKNVKQKVRSSTDLTDGTYDLITKAPVSYSDGYQCSFETDSRNYESGYYTDEEYDDLVYKLAAILNVNASLGVYENVPEISYHIKDKNTSLAMAALYNQISVWDWVNDYELLNQFRQNKYS